MHSRNTCNMYEGFCIGCKNTAESFFFSVHCFPTTPPPPTTRALCASSYIVYYHYLASPTPSCNKQHHTYGYVTCYKINARSSLTSSDVTI
jgi:hypothetical protein